MCLLSVLFKMKGMNIQVVFLIYFSGYQCLSHPLSEVEISNLAHKLQENLQHLSHSPNINQPRVGFRHRYVDRAGACHDSQPIGPSIHVVATTTVSNTALSKACTMVGLMTRHMSTNMFNHISRGHGVGLFSKSEGIGIYPENYHLRDTPECKGTCNGTCDSTCTFDGRKFDSLAGFANNISVVLDDNVLCNDRDPYGNKENILVHEYAHQIQVYMPIEDQEKLKYIFKYAKEHHTWNPGYGTENDEEYWAEATEAFFHVTIRNGTNSPAVGMVE